MKIHTDVIQGSPEWHKLREMRLTASKAQAIASNGAGLKTLVIDLFVNKYSSNTEKYTNSDIERGNKLEPIARGMYELEYDCTIEEVGFIEIDKYTGLSPDGKIKEHRAGLEIKALNDANHMKAILFGIKGIEPKYIWQCQMSLLLTEMEYWELVLFNPNYEKSLLVHRIFPDEKAFEKLRIGIENGKTFIRELKKKYELQ